WKNCDRSPNAVTLNIPYGAPRLRGFPHAPCHLCYDEAAYGPEAKYQQGRRRGGRCRGVEQAMAVLRGAGLPDVSHAPAARDNTRKACRASLREAWALCSG